MITTDKVGNSIVLFTHIIFRGKRSIPWDEVEEYLLRYVGKSIEIIETKDVIHIGRDFVDEFAGSVYTRKLKGGVAKAKANMVQGIVEIIKIAKNKRWNQDFENKHGKKAQKGWFRYNTRFAIPIINDEGEIIRYNIYQAVLVVRHASDDRLYLYDIQNIKKETSNPL